jgi:hypothetical protein
MKNRRDWYQWVILLASVVFHGVHSEAAVIYVDNRLGNDARDGSTEGELTAEHGSVRTLRRALALADAGDTIILKNNGTPYYGSLVLCGARHSGSTDRRFTIVGNGAVIDGSQAVPTRAWRRMALDLWRFTPWRKGHYQLILDEAPMAEFRIPEKLKSSDELPEIPVGQWCVHKGSIYYRSAPLVYPSDLKLRFAEKTVGLSLHQVHDVQVLDVTFRWFRVDGANAPDLCRNVVLENVASLENGRSGLFSGGSSDVVARNCRFAGNRISEVMIRGLGAVELDQTELSRPPSFIE